MARSRGGKDRLLSAVRSPRMLAAASVAGAFAIFVVAIAVGRFGDAPLFLLIVPLAVASVAFGLRGGLALALLASLLATAWWVDSEYPGGVAWLVSRVVAVVAVGTLLGWVADSRHALEQTIAHHRQHSLDLIATASFDGYFIEVNPAFTRTLGFSPEELLAEPFMTFVHPDDRESTLAAVVEQTEQGQEILSFQNRYRTKDGSYRWLEWTSCPDPAGKTLIAVARDVTDRKELEELEREYQQRLERNVRERTKELNRRNTQLDAAKQEILDRLARAAEFRDDETFEHTKRIGHSAAAIASALGLPEAEVGLIRDAAPLHDIGKLGVSDVILHKPDALTPAERERMKTHAATGAAILRGSSSSSVLRAAVEICRSHHERWDGTGYPDGLTGEEIPLPARIVALADVFDALTHERPYKRAWVVEDAVAEIRRLRGVHFDPRIVDAFERLDPYELAGLERPTPRLASSSGTTRAA